MNTKIARRLNEASKCDNSGRVLDRVGNGIVYGHNIAVINGFLELPILGFVGADTTEKTISVLVAPKSGMIAMNDIYNLKTAWGADDVNIHTADKSIELVYYKK